MGSAMGYVRIIGQTSDILCTLKEATVHSFYVNLQDLRKTASIKYKKINLELGRELQKDVISLIQKGPLYEGYRPKRQ